MLKTPNTQFSIEWLFKQNGNYTKKEKKIPKFRTNFLEIQCKKKRS